MDALAQRGTFKHGWGPAVEVIASTRTDRSPQFSPDGKKIAFVSDRSGTTEIWVSRSDGKSPEQLSAICGAYCGSPRWSPDGRRILFDSFASGNNDIWIISSGGGQAKRATFEPSDDNRASWSRGGKWIYFRSDRSGAGEIWKIPSESPFQPAVQITRKGASEAFESLDGRILYFVKPDGGLWSLPVEGGEEALVLEPIQQAYWGIAENGVYFLGLRRRATPTEMRDGLVPGRSPTPLQFFSFAQQTLTQIGRIEKEVDRSRSGFSVTRDGRAIVWSQIDRREADLMLIDNFR